jgi:dihydrofolate synthase/folylpolyglutamate synthase
MRSPAVEWLYGLQHFGIKLGLHNISKLLDILERPDRDMAILHVAGTNGKGSVAAMLDAILRADGLSTGLFTSPHLIRPSERIRIDGADLSEAAFDAAVLRLRDVLETCVGDRRLEAHPSFFEVVTATALTEFRAAGVDVGVLEVGLGGRLDATNAADTDVSIVVSVDLDHTKTLGDTIEKIAFEKAGIVRPGVPVVSGVERAAARDVVRAVARERGAPWIDAREVASIEPGPDRSFTVVTERARYADLRCALSGRHQWDNARVAIVALEAARETLGRTIPPDAVARGLAATRWPGRLQWVEGRPRMLFDGAHNPAGIAALADYLAEHPIEPRPVLLYGTTREKDLDRVLAPLLPHVGVAVVSRAGIDRAMDPDTIGSWLRERGREVTVTLDAAAGLAEAREAAGSDGVVLITGSLYLVGDVLTSLEVDDAPGPVAM